MKSYSQEESIKLKEEARGSLKYTPPEPPSVVEENNMSETRPADKTQTSLQPDTKQLDGTPTIAKKEEPAKESAAPVSTLTNMTANVAEPQEEKKESEIKEIASKETETKETETKPECPPRIMLSYKTRKSEETNVRKAVVEPLMKEQIEASSLPFGMVGTRFDYTLDFSSKDLVDHFGEVEFLSCLTRGLKELGLSCSIIDENTSIQLTGVPTQEFTGIIEFFLVRHDLYNEAQNEAGASQICVKPLCSKPFTINEHPRNLWKDLEVDDWEGYKNEHTANSGKEVTFPSGRQIEFIGASRRGRSHAHTGKPRDDYFCFEVDEETGWCFAAVADGAGSAKYSRKGSELACETAVRELRTLINADFDKIIRSDKLALLAGAREVFMQSDGKWSDAARLEFGEKTELDARFHIAIHKAYMAIHEESEKKGVQPRDYHTTLLCTAFKYFSEREINGWFFASYWVGDGGAAILRWNGTDKVLVLGEPDGGEFAGQTIFLTMKDEIQAESIKNRVRFSFCDTFEALLVVTDGITDPFFPSESAVADGHRWLEFYEEKLQKECEEEPNGCRSLLDSAQTAQKKSEDLLEWLNFWSKGNHDDRTMLIVKPR